MRLFLAHSWQDKPFARRLVANLREVGIDVWFDEWEIKAGDSIVAKVGEGLASDGFFVIVLSEKSLRSRWLQRELNSSLMHRLTQERLAIIPVLIEDCAIPALLADIRCADFRESYDRGLRQLLEGLGQTAPLRLPNPSTRVATMDGGVRQKVMPAPLSGLPELFGNEPSEVVMVVGSTTREQAPGLAAFRSPDVEVRHLDQVLRFRRNVAAGTVRDSYLCADLAVAFARATGSSGDPVSTLCVPDVAVDRSMLRRNLVLIGAADTNIWFGAAVALLSAQFGGALPVGYTGDASGYFTCDEIYSDFSGQTYPRLEESGAMHTGYVLLTVNPWAWSRYALFVSGLRATGTQAAFRAILLDSDELIRSGKRSDSWRWLSAGNRYAPGAPAKVVRATRASVISGPELLGDLSDVPVPATERISQRHIVTDFVYCE